MSAVDSNPIEQQLDLWAQDPEQEIYIQVRHAVSVLAPTYRGILKKNSWGYYLKADEIIGQIRGIALNVSGSKAEFGEHAILGRYILITAPNGERVTIYTKDPFDVVPPGI